MREAYAAGVLRIVSVSRDPFEAAAAAGGAPVPEEDLPKKKKKKGSQGSGDAGPVALGGGSVEGSVPMSVERFTFEVVAKEESLVELLNRIARVDMFAVVTRVDFAKNSPDYVLAPSPEAEAAARAPGRTAVANPMPPTRTARLVSGRDREASLKVSLDVEVYSFEGEV